MTKSTTTATLHQNYCLCKISVRYSTSSTSHNNHNNHSNSNNNHNNNMPVG